MDARPRRSADEYRRPPFQGHHRAPRDCIDRVGKPGIPRRPRIITKVPPDGCPSPWPPARRAIRVRPTTGTHGLHHRRRCNVRNTGGIGLSARQSGYPRETLRSPPRLPAQAPPSAMRTAPEQPHHHGQRWNHNTSRATRTWIAARPRNHRAPTPEAASWLGHGPNYGSSVLNPRPCCARGRTTTEPTSSISLFRFAIRYNQSARPGLGTYDARARPRAHRARIY